MESFDANISAFMQWLLKATIQGSLLVCLIMLIKLMLKEKLSSRWYYWLWLVLLIRLALPWAPQSRFSLYSLILNSLPSHRITSNQSVVLTDETDFESDVSLQHGMADDTSVTGQNGTSQRVQGIDSGEKNLPETAVTSSRLSLSANGQNRQNSMLAVHV